MKTSLSLSYTHTHRKRVWVCMCVSLTRSHRETFVDTHSHVVTHSQREREKERDRVTHIRWLLWERRCHSDKIAANDGLVAGTVQLLNFQLFGSILVRVKNISLFCSIFLSYWTHLFSQIWVKGVNIQILLSRTKSAHLSLLSTLEAQFRLIFTSQNSCNECIDSEVIYF